MLATLDPRCVYKILTAAAWSQFLASGTYAGSADDLRDGYVHLSDAEQVAATVERHYAHAVNLVLVALDPQALGAALRHEASRAGALFPHSYAPLPLSACTLLARRAQPSDPWLAVDA